MPDTFVKLGDGSTVNVNDVTLPADRQFRDAWESVGPGQAVQIDMAKARDIAREKIARAAQPVLREELEKFAVAEAEGDATGKANAAARVKELRNAKLDSAIDNANSPQALKALNPAGLDWLDS